MSSRLDLLQQFLKEDPNDPFNIYALALEYQKHDIAKALFYFNELLNNHPDYLPTYYHLGKLYQELQEREKGLAVFQQGIEKAKLKQDSKTLRELQAAYLELEFE